MNGFHLTVVAACVFMCQPVVNAQSVITSELTVTTLASSVDAAGRTVLTAAVVTTGGSGIPGGTIRFVDETTLLVLGWADVGHPSITVDRLPDGLHRFRAVYGGTADFLPVIVQPSESGLVVQTVRSTPAISVSSSDNPCASGAMVTLTAAIASPGHAPSGAVTFRDGEIILAAHVGIDRSGSASFTTSALLDGSRAITAEFEGDAVHAPARSPRLVLDVGAAPLRSSQLENAD